MPYGLPKHINTSENNQKIEECVSKLVSQGKDKVSAIRICKASIMKHAALDTVKK